MFKIQLLFHMCLFDFILSESGIFAERRKRIPKGKAVFASLFGVGAPEALVIGVVALLVFGPKGLAEVSYTILVDYRNFGGIWLFQICLFRLNVFVDFIV